MLTDIQIKNIKKTDKIQKIFEGAGFYVYVSAIGSKTFRLDYTYGGKRKTLSIGKYPAMSLLDAREKLNQARKAIEKGLDPSEKKKVDKAAIVARVNNTFAAAFQSWIDKEKVDWKPEHYQHVQDRQDKYILPHLGKRALESITPPEILVIIKKIKSNDIGHRALSDIKRTYD